MHPFLTTFYFFHTSIFPAIFTYLLLLTKSRSSPDTRNVKNAKLLLAYSTKRMFIFICLISFLSLWKGIFSDFIIGTFLGEENLLCSEELDHNWEW